MTNLLPFAGQTGYGQRQDLRAWRIDRDCDREDCGGDFAEIDLATYHKALSPVSPGFAPSLAQGKPRRDGRMRLSLLDIGANQGLASTSTTG